MQLALGLIETKGLIGAIEAADAMLKAANVKLVSKEKVTGALMCIKIVGETAAVKAAVDAGAAAAQRVGELYATHVIPHPDNQIDDLIFNYPAKVKSEKLNKPESPKEEAKKPAEVKEVVSLFSEDKKEEPDNGDNIDDEWNEDKENEVEMSTEVPSKEELELLNVHQLRRLARAQENFPIKGRDISKANRQELLEHFKSIR